NGYFPQSLRQIRILILEILQCIPVVNPADSGTSSLTLRKLSHFWMDTTPYYISKKTLWGK
ncbi:MAG: hypothetical protein L6406_00905, partial [Desulfobacterales bacterium]|nr:hypothetical protein [Desulfobacterales bacterium]